MAKIVLFVDALEPREYGAGWEGTERGMVESGYPKVTPKVTSEVYTGVSPSVNGMGQTHSMKGQMPGRPMMPLIQEKLEMAGYRVASLHMPYCLPLQLRNGAWISTAMQQQQTGGNPLTDLCAQPPQSGDLRGDEDEKKVAFNSRIDDLYAKSSSMLNAMRVSELDVMFIAVRTPDQYTHFGWHDGYRERIIEALAQEVVRWEQNHEILWWSDHGSEEKKETFRVNKWLMEKGYLDLDMDLEFNERFRKVMEERQPQQAQNANADIENQLGVQSPGVELLDSSQAVCMDAYDSCIDVLDDELDKKELISDLMDTGHYEGIELVEDQWGKGRFLDSCPDLVTLRADHVLVTGNVHPEPEGMGDMRTGVHSKLGAWGTTDDTLDRSGDVTPRELHDVIWEFVTGDSQIKQEVSKQVQMMQEQMEMIQPDREEDEGVDESVRQRLEDLGYV